MKRGRNVVLTTLKGPGTHNHSTKGIIAQTNIFNGTTLVTRYGYDGAWLLC